MKLVAIAGGSGSGKTTLAQYLLKQNPTNTLLISLDNYYLNKDEQIKQNGFCNYDHPLALDKKLLLKNIEELKTFGETKIPQYCFKKRDRTGYLTVKRCDIIIIEGLYAVDFLKDFDVFKIYVEAENDLLLARRIQRDIENRNRTIDNILRQYFDEVKPAYEMFISSQKIDSNLVIANNKKLEKFLNKIKGLI